MNIARLQLRKAIFVFLLLGLTFLAEHSNAQVVTVLNGTITDQVTGQPINGAAVTLYKRTRSDCEHRWQRQLTGTSFWAPKKRIIAKY
jgi:hypothetical protein